MMAFLLKNRVRRSVSFTLLFIIVSELIFPAASMALTSGPSQPEVQGFEPISTSDMVDVSSGDFKYNIPLMDIEGYPINIAYASGISTDQEASWVGLGWNLNVGAINRAMRGLPDDFKGEKIHKELNTQPNRTYGLNVGVDFELFGKASNNKPGAKKGKGFKVKPSIGVGVNYNNYNGFGVQYSVGMGISAGNSGKGALNANLGLTSDAASGLDISPNLSYSAQNSKKSKTDESLSNTNSASASIGGGFNSRGGLKQLTFGASYSRSAEKTTKNSDGSSSSETIAQSSKSGSGCVNFGLQSYSPSTNWSMVNNSALLTVKFGAQLFGNDLNVSIGGFYSSQDQIDKTKDVESYGYMYSEYANNNEHVMLDYNREKDGSYSRTTKNLPLTSFTYDVFNVTAHGIGGAFRPFRSDVGHVYDASTKSKSDSYSLGADLSGGNLLKGGIDISVVDVNSKTGRWEDGNNALDYFKFKAKSLNSKYEPYYFKRVGEMSSNPENLALYNSLMGDRAYGIQILQGFSNQASAVNSNLPNIRSQRKLEVSNYDTNPTSLVVNTNSVDERQKRNQFMNTLTRSEAALVGLQKDLYNNTGVDRITTPSAPMKAYNAKEHHIAEVSVVSPDGMRYYYGLPAYNIRNKECSFNVSPQKEVGSGLVSYNASNASLGNKSGTDRYYSMTETPAYAYSYLLTSVVSPDYADINGNGPDDSDIGTYTKFHYIKSTSGANNYFWRMPVHSSPGFANFSENSKSNNQDNMGNYTYGEKEIWFVDEIETRNYVAKFILSNRDDALGVIDELGNIGGAESKRIEKIILYSKKEYKADQVAAVPIKTVHFEYDYSLCDKLPNNINHGGKLTLKKIFFTYGKSNRAFFNKYEFTYASGSGNPDYHWKAYDRWGNYKPVFGGVVDYNASQPKTNAEFPYVEQNKATADVYASAWSLKQIKLPSGAQITINYESDDYAFVQNIPAGQMFNVVGTFMTQPTDIVLPGSTDLYQSTGINNSYLIVDLNSTAPMTDEEFVNRYLKDISEYGNKLFFKFLVNLTSATATNPNFLEYVSGYVDVKIVNSKAAAGLIRVGNTPTGAPTGKAWILLDEAPLKNKGTTPKINPIAMTAIQFARLNYGNVVWGANFSPSNDVEDALKQLANAAKNSLKTMITGFKSPNKALADFNYCKQFVPAKSMVRLYNPDGKRLGGGSRVSSIAINDNWESMTTVGATGQASTTYEQSYSYETTDYGRKISSGVASYEPMIGSEENSMKQPFYLGKNKWAILAPDDRYYVEGPFGESFFPSPNICYSKVTIRNKYPVGVNVPSSGKNGFKVYEFYTAKDYPTIVKHTPIMPKQFRNPLKSVVKIAQTDLVYASQGYAIITNDMHGKPKAELDYSENSSEDTPERSVRYYYKTKGGYQNPEQRGLKKDASYSANVLNNVCKVIEKDGKVSTTSIGIDFDAIADFRESETETISGSAQINLQSFLIGVIPVIAPTIWPSAQYELTRFRSAVLTKVINHYGILERTEVKVDNSIVTSESIAYDAETGNVLVSKTTNDFEDPVYNVQYPAHWGYDRMGGAYKNAGIVLTTLPGSSSGLMNVASAPTYLKLGDEVLLKNGTGSEKAWVTSLASNIVGLSDVNGNPATLATSPGTGTLKVIRSGRRHLLNSNMSVLTCLKYPIVNVGGIDKLQITNTSEVLNASGVKYSDDWQIPLGLSNVGGCSCTSTPLGVSFVGFLQSMFNWNLSGVFAANDVRNPFLNGTYTSPPNTTIQNNATCLWRDPTMAVPVCPGASTICSMPTGFPAWPAGSKNHAFTQAMLNEMPLSNPCAGSSHQYVVWNGPPQSAGENSLFTGDKIIGYFATCSSTFPFTIDFTAPTFSSTSKTQFYNFCQNLPNGTNMGGTTYFTFNVSPNQTDCNSNELAMNLCVHSNGPCLANYPVKISSSFLNGKLINNCQSPNGPVSYVCGNLPGYKVNPFVVGIKGNWRSKVNYTYLTDRVQTVTSAANGSNTDVRRDGYYSAFTGIYSNLNAPGTYNDWQMALGSGTNKWVNTVESSKYNQYGVEIETKDALGRYSSAVYGYNESLPVAVASNAQLREIGYDGFEDYSYFNTSCNREPHFAFRQAVVLNYAALNTVHAHTGKYSLQVSNTATATVSKMVSSTQQQVNTNVNYFNYQIADPDFIYPFYPVSTNPAGVNYLLTYWVKEAGVGTQPLDYLNNNVTITQGSGAAFSTGYLKKSLLIDGWQRMEKIFIIPAGYSGPLNINLINTSANANLKVYYDDIRVHPANSKMKSYVYHPVTFKYMAELDENNYASFYEYDDQGNLIRVKKETERGVMTIKESKTHYAQ